MEEEVYYCPRDQINKTPHQAKDCDCRRGGTGCLDLHSFSPHIICNVLEQYKLSSTDSIDPIPEKTRRRWTRPYNQNTQGVQYAGR